MSQLGNYVKRRREQKGWTRAELARTSGVPYSTLANIELNPKKVKPTEETLKSLASALEENGDDSQLRALSGYDVKHSQDVSDRAKRIDALLSIAPRWERVLWAIGNEYTPEEADEALTQLEVHHRIVLDRRKQRGDT